MSIVSVEKPSVKNLQRLLVSNELSHAIRMGLEAYSSCVSKGEVRVEYTKPSFGRFVAKAKLGKHETGNTGMGMVRGVRNALFSENYDDIDIVNASGNVMAQFFTRYGLPTSQLDRYNASREEYLNQLISWFPIEIPRTTAKNVFISLFFCGSGMSSIYKYLPVAYHNIPLPEFVTDLQTEFNHNIDTLMEHDDFKAHRQFILSKKPEAWAGTFSSILYQDEENKILSTMVDVINDIAKMKKISSPTGALIHDGLHVLKTMNIRCHLLHIEEMIKTKLGYSIKLEIKPMPIDETIFGEIPDDRSIYEYHKEEFEKFHFKLKDGEKPFIHYSEDDIYHYNRSSFITVSEDAFIGASAFLKQWFLDPNKRTYRYIEHSYVKPENQCGDVFYAHPPIAYLSMNEDEKTYESDVAIIKDYLLAIAEEKETQAEFLVAWLADIIQNPDHKPDQPICVFLYGKPGSGKSFLRHLVACILGERLVHHTSKPEANGDICHDFNSALSYKKFIELEEVNLKVHAALADRLKAMITNTHHNITKKGREPETITAAERYLYTSNFMYIVLDKDDRRHVCYETSNRLVGKTDYWKSMYNHLKRESFVANIARFFLSFNLKAYGGLRDRRPITKLYKTLTQFSLPCEIHFLRDIANRSYDECDAPNQILKVGSTQLYKDFSAWTTDSGYKDKMTHKMFSSKLKMLEEKYGLSTNRESEGIVYHIHLPSLRSTLNDLLPDD